MLTTDHKHYCLVCSDGRKPGPGCINCRSTGYDQTPCLDCQGQTTDFTDSIEVFDVDGALTLFAFRRVEGRRFWLNKRLAWVELDLSVEYDQSEMIMAAD